MNKSPVFLADLKCVLNPRQTLQRKGIFMFNQQIETSIINIRCTHEVCKQTYSMYSWGQVHLCHTHYMYSYYPYFNLWVTFAYPYKQNENFLQKVADFWVPARTELRIRLLGEASHRFQKKYTVFVISGKCRVNLNYSKLQQPHDLCKPCDWPSKTQCLDYMFVYMLPSKPNLARQLVEVSLVRHSNINYSKGLLDNAVDFF